MQMHSVKKKTRKPYKHGDYDCSNRYDPHNTELSRCGPAECPFDVETGEVDAEFAAMFAR